MRRDIPKIHQPMLNSWGDRFRDIFLPVIRQRGNRYAHEGKVILKDVSPENISATVFGTYLYTVSVVDRRGEDGKFSVSCTCPFFRQGYPCKHLWAAMVKADKALALEASESAPASETDRVPVAKKVDWRWLFSDDLWQGNPTAPPWIEGSSQFVLCYELNITHLGTEVSVLERYIKKDGTLGRNRRLQASTIEHQRLPKVDRAIIAMLDNARRRQTESYHRAYHQTNRNFVGIALEPRDLELVLPLLAETKRCKAFHSVEGLLADPLQKGNPPAAALKLATEQKGNRENGDFSLVPVLQIGSEDKDILLSDISAFLPTRPVLFIRDGYLFELPGPSLSWIRTVLKSGKIEVPQKDARELLLQTESFTDILEISLPEGMAPKAIEGSKPSPLLIVELVEDFLRAKVFMNYEGLEIDWNDSRRSILDTERWMQIERHEEAETDFVKKLHEKGFRQEDGVFHLDTKKAAKALSDLAKDGCTIEGRDRRPFRGGRVSKLSISSGIDWFDLQGGISFGEYLVPLPRAVRAFLKGERTVKLDDGSVGLLPEEWFSHNLPALELSAASGRKSSPDKALRFSSTQALVLDALLEENEVESVDQRFLEIRNVLKDFSGIEKVPVPAGFKGVLRPYQEEALSWFDFLRKFGFGGMLADDMGLGKTVQVLAWLAGEMENGQSRPSLVIAPTSLLFNWQTEAKRFIPGIRILTYTGNNRSDLVREMDQADLILTTYGLARRDIEALKDLEFNYIILDESQTIKNSGSMIARTVRLLKAGHKLCLTGTPLENNVGELWSQMEFLNPGLLGSKAVFDRRFARPIANGDETARDSLKRMVTAFILRRTKDAVALDLPDKTDHVIRCPMTDGQTKVYGQVRDHYRDSILTAVEQHGLNRSNMKVLEGLLRLRQAANHPGLIGDFSAGSGKLNELTTMLRGVLSSGHKALVFSQFTKMLRLIRDTLDDAGVIYEYLDGRTPRAKREERVRRFQEDRDVKLFLISIKAGGLGLNLTAADYVFIVDPWWNPAVELQAVDRTHRIGQDKRVFTYRFITAGTVEEKILGLQEKKRELVKDMMKGAQDMPRHLSREDLDFLFS